LVLNWTETILFYFQSYKKMT